MKLSRRTLVVASLLAVAAIVTAALLTLPRRTVHVQFDSQTLTIATRARTVAGALREASVGLDPADRVTPALGAALEPGQLILVERAPLVGLYAGGDAVAHRTHAQTPQAVLSELGLVPGAGDELWTGTEASIAELAGWSPWTLRLWPAATMRISDDGAGPVSFQIAARNVGEALWKSGFRLYAGDGVRPGLEAALTPNLLVEVERAQPVWVQADDQTMATRTRSQTVAPILREVGVALVGLDYTLPAEDQPRPASGVISVVRVREEILAEQSLLPYDTIYQTMPEVEIDNVYQLQAGQPGVLRRLTRVRYENGVEVSRVTEAEVRLQEPAAQVIGYGTQITVRTVATPDGTVEYWRAYSMYATSYAAKFFGIPTDSPRYGRTASGKLLTKGIVAIDRSLIPFGTRMYVPGYGFAEAADTGGGVKGRWIDLGFDDWNYVGWHSAVMVYFLTPIPPLDKIEWIIPTTVP